MDGRALTSALNARNKKGYKAPKTLLREEVFREMAQRVFLMSHKILNAQMIQAVGTHKMIQIMNGPGGTKITRTIRSMEEQQKLLDEGVYGIDYVVLEGRPQDWKAGNAILDRMFGKAKETFDINQKSEVVTPEAMKSTDEAIWEYMQGKRSIKVPEDAKPKKVDELNFNNG